MNSVLALLQYFVDQNEKDVDVNSMEETESL